MHKQRIAQDTLPVRSADPGQANHISQAGSQMLVLPRLIRQIGLIGVQKRGDQLLPHIKPPDAECGAALDEIGQPDKGEIDAGDFDPRRQMHPGLAA